ncbi:phosphatase inhibitor-domain-containing protein [Pilobolus umbonatus]|nr:phosphatase inhibitor-domain-containing protein [Pilobolus umbonatus]
MSSPQPVDSRTRMREETPAHGSRTVIVEDIETESETESDSTIGVLRLRGDMSARRPRVIQWDENVVDNEHMNKKKTKICCIYHKPHVVGESSDESSSSSDSQTSDSEDERKQRCKGKKKNPREVSPNAYERQPVYNKGKQMNTQQKKQMLTCP